MSGLDRFLETMGPVAAASMAAAGEPQPDARPAKRLLTNEEHRLLPTMQQRREAALTYALWDAENTTRLERPEQYEATLPLARGALRWLHNRGWHLHQQETREDHWLVAKLERRVRRLCWALGVTSLLLLAASATLLLR